MVILLSASDFLFMALIASSLDAITRIMAGVEVLADIADGLIDLLVDLAKVSPGPSRRLVRVDNIVASWTHLEILAATLMAM